MLSMTKIVLPLAIVLGTASAAFAVSKDASALRHGARNAAASVQHQAPGRVFGRSGRSGYAFAPATRSPETYIDIQTIGVREWNG